MLSDAVDQPIVVIKHNKYARHEACGVCDSDRPLCIGPCLFIDGTWAGVCEECARELAPGMVAMLACTEAQRAYWIAERDEAEERFRAAREGKLETLQAHLAFLEGQLATTQAQINQLKEGDG